MLRCVGLMVFATAFLGCQATPLSSRAVESDKTICSKHHIPLVSVRAFTPSNIVGIEYSDDCFYACEVRWPNCLPPGFSLHRTRYYDLAMRWAYCPRCEDE